MAENETKPGIKTTEFWVVVAALVSSFTGTFNDLIAQGRIDANSAWVATAGTVLALVYAIVRTLAKR